MTPVAGQVAAGQVAAGQVAAGQVNGRLPNIIFVLADDLGYGDLGCYGQQTIQTPQLDQMAAEGMRFTQFYAGSTVCAPSRCVLMTGKHLGHCTVRGNGSGPEQALRPEDVTVAAQHPQVVRELDAILQEAHVESPLWKSPGKP
ncbi:MAG: sulfatase-like hydrolase/transferase [Planctomycetales bacterium]|nr:sulfatase-like hydrolase/transferase [Planctomycetales bacterium]